MGTLEQESRTHLGHCKSLHPSSGLKCLVEFRQLTLLLFSHISVVSLTRADIWSDATSPGVLEGLKRRITRRLSKIDLCQERGRPLPWSLRPRETGANREAVFKYFSNTCYKSAYALTCLAPPSPGAFRGMLKGCLFPQREGHPGMLSSEVASPGSFSRTPGSRSRSRISP